MAAAELTFRLQDPERGIIGPIGMDTLLELVRAGVVAADVCVSRDGGPFVPLATVPEFSRWTKPMAPAANRTGPLSDSNALGLLWQLNKDDSTALLVLRDGELRKDAYVRGGKLVFLSSNLSTERLGRFLVSRGKLSEADLEVALASMHTDNNRLGQTLVRLGLIEPRELELELCEQQIMRLVELCCWRQGSFEIIAGKGFPGGEAELDRPIPELLLHVARSLPENVLVGDLIGRMHLVPVIVSADARKAFPYTELEWRVVDRLDGMHAGAEVVAPFAADEIARHAALAVLDLLVLTGLLELRRGG
jgi:hypothetical protein